MFNKRFLLYILFTISILSVLGASPVISADINEASYDIGDIVTVKVQIDENSGIRGMFFDLSYDSQKLLFMDINEGLMVQRVPQENSLLHAHTSEQTALGLGGHLIVSWFIDEKNVVTMEEGTFIEARFRVIDRGLSDESFQFSFNDNQVIDVDSNIISSAIWNDSAQFLLYNTSSGNYINFVNPSNNLVVNSSSIDIDALYSVQPGQTLVALNISHDYATPIQEAITGSLENLSIDIEEGANRISLRLFDNQGFKIAEDEITVIRDDYDDLLQFRSPIDHSLVNTNMVKIKLSSRYADPTLNGIDMETLGEPDLDNSENTIYFKNYYLKEGFNTLKAEVIYNESIYTKEITIYYHKDDSVFRFVTPGTNSVINVTEQTSFEIKGEISSLLDEDYLENIVHVQAIYTPRNPSKSSQVIQELVEADIVETDIASSTSSYMFVLDNPISIENLEPGTIELIAYKNKRGNYLDAEIHRIFYIDNNQLYIDLVQPNIYTSDILDTMDKLTYFNNANSPNLNGIELTSQGSLALSSSDTLVEELADFASKSVADIIRTKQGDMYVLINEANKIEIYKKVFGQNNWVRLLLEQDNMYGYDLCETDLGILVGVSNLFNNGNSGLYLLQDSTLTNITIGEPIPHVQFINEDDGYISLYGNDYSWLYTFNIYSLEESGDRLRAGITDKNQFDNNYFIKNFYIANNGNSAVIHTLDDKVLIYSKNSSGSFQPVVIQGGSIDQNQDFTKVIVGEYSDGEYNAYLLIQDDNKTPVVVMEHKNSQRFVINGQLEFPFLEEEILVGVDFFENLFTFITYESISGNYRIRRKQVLFNSLHSPVGFSSDYYEEFTPVSGISNIPTDNLSLLQCDDSLFYAGFDIESNGLWSLRTEYPSSGDCDFLYKNEDIEGINSFSFEVESSWVDSENLKFAFAIGSAGNYKFGTINSTKDLLLTITIEDLLNIENEMFSVSREYIFNKEGNHVERITVSFTNIQIDEELYFDLDLLPTDGISPEIQRLTVTKKVAVKLPKVLGEDLFLPIHGYIYDPTVTTIKIGNDPEDVINGTFTAQYKIKTDQNTQTIELECFNSSGIEASLSFNVELYESVNSIDNITFTTHDGTNLTMLNNYISTVDEIVLISGNYDGLIGAVTGYEIRHIDNDAVLRTGLFDTNETSLLDGKVTGSFTDQIVTLFPNEQYINIFVENPGGYRTVYTIGADNKRPIINFTLPTDEQGIELHNLEINQILIDETFELEGITFDKDYYLIVNEDSNSYVFTSEINVRGQVYSNSNMQDIKVKSYHPEVLFENGEQEIIIPIDSVGRFNIDLVITMPEELQTDDYNISFIPTAPFLYSLSQGLVIHAEKSFTNSYVVPDFNGLMDGDSWSINEIQSLSKPVRVQIDRFIPADGTTMQLIVNYEETIIGTLKEVNPGTNVYKLMDGLTEIELDGAKLGSNRIQWWINYDNKTISSSAQNRTGMEDFLFNLSGDSNYIDTTVNFAIENQVYYADDTLPQLTVNKDVNTEIEITFNGNNIQIDNDLSVIGPINLSDLDIIEGKNSLIIIDERLDGTVEELVYEFLYDNIDPEVQISSYEYDITKTKLVSLSALATEYNLKDAVIIYSLSGIESEYNADPQYSYLGDGRFQIVWDLSAQNLQPTVDDYIYIQISDHAGNDGVTAHFTGLDSSLEQESDVEAFAILIPEDARYINKPFMESEPGITPFSTSTGRLKFYPSDIGIEDFSILSDYQINRPSTVTLSNEDGSRGVEVQSNNSLTVSSGESIVLNNGFSVKQDGSLHLMMISDSSIIPEADQFVFTHMDDLDSMSFAFYYRFEQELFYNYDNDFKPILTLLEYNDADLEIERIMLASVPVSNDNNSESKLVIIREKGIRSAINDPYVYESPEIILDASSFVLSKTGPLTNDWNRILLSVSKIGGTSGSFTLTLNDLAPITAEYSLQNSEIIEGTNIFTEILKNNANHYFGASDPENNGHFSIAQPFYVNAAINMDDIELVEPELPAEYQQLETFQRRTYDFDTNVDDIRDGEDLFYNLNMTNPTSFYSDVENVDYSDAEKGSMLATSAHRNYLMVNQAGMLIFSNSIEPATYDINADREGDNLVLTPTNNLSRPGRYFFSKKQGNHELTNNKYYSVYGSVVSDENNQSTEGEAWLVLYIDGKEERVLLQDGDFHLVFDNSSNETPSSVKLYIETTRTITIQNDIVMTEGNYRLPAEATNGLEPNRAETQYSFSITGSIDLWYKPININSEGFSSYPVTIFDSEYVKIYTEVVGGVARYKAHITGDNPAIVYLASDMPVTRGWHNLQVSYSIPDGVAYFYVDGQVAAAYEGNLPYSPSMKDYVPTSDNLAIGGSVGNPLFNADGFIDSVVLSRIFLGPQYQDMKPVFYSYSQNRDDFNQTDSTLFAEISISTALSSSADNINYTLFSRDGSYREIFNTQSVNDLGFIANDLVAGAYTLRASMDINGYRFEDQLSFIKDNRPSFKVTKSNPLIINGVESDINFAVRYDQSYLIQSDDGVFPGFALQIRGVRETAFEETIYVYQNPEVLDRVEWLYEIEGSSDEAQPVVISDNALNLKFAGIISVEDIEWELRSFYFDNAFNSSTFNFDRISTDIDGGIPMAILSIKKPLLPLEDDEIEYKLIIEVGNGSGTVDATLLDKLTIVTRAISTDPLNPVVEETVFQLNDTTLNIFYEDILPGFGVYDCGVSLRYEGETCSADQLLLTWRSTEDTHGEIETTPKQLSISEFGLLYIDKDSVNGQIESSAKLYLEYEQMGLDFNLFYDIQVYASDNGSEYYEFYSNNRVSLDGSGFVIIDSVTIPSDSSRIEITVYEWDGVQKLLDETTTLSISNDSLAPVVVITNSVPNRIAYNNVLFTWKGYYNGEYRNEIEFSYNFDDQGDSTFSNTNTSLELFALDEGFHVFKVVAKYNSKESVIQSVPFFVDVNKPAFDNDQIVVNPQYDTNGIIRSVEVYGNIGAVTDISLSSLWIDGQKVSFFDDGSFSPITIDVDLDGENSISCIAYDEVGNFTENIIPVINPITEILFPVNSELVLYAPSVLVGKINNTISAELEIFLADPETATTDLNDLDSWKKAVINSDRTFFIEDVYINPGTRNRETNSNLLLAVRTPSGRVYTKEITVSANELIIPIEMEFSSHALEGESSPTEVTINCIAHVNNISSWSIDFNGDGIYDEIRTINNEFDAHIQEWTHTYSSLGLVTPRVRVITKDGKYFSVSDQIIIHEQISESSNLLVEDPISLSSIRLEDGSDRLFTLAGSSGDYRVEVFEVGRNDNYISNRLYTISLEGMDIENPVNILALDKDHLVVAANRGGRGFVYLLQANEFGNYINLSDLSFSVNNLIKEVESDGDYLYITVEGANYIAKVELENLLPKKSTLAMHQVTNDYLEEIGGNLSLTRVNDSIIIGDYDNNRVLTLDQDFNITNYYDDFGSGEREFQRPTLLESSENRIFVFDEVRKDIQVFDSNFNSVATLSYSSESSSNYMEFGTMDDLLDISIVTRNEGNRLFYYALMISGTTQKLSMIRLPQWEELRASVRNNKIVFLKDREIFTAKPDGSDLTRILSSDSLPRIEGTLDYPAISPDGSTIVFTSRVRLYDGSAESTLPGDQYAYDNLYMVDINGENLTRIPLGDVNNYEIERPVFNSNGDKIIFSAKPSGGNWQIYIYHRESGGISRLFNSDENARFPYYSPDDRFIVFTTDHDGDEEVVIADVENVNMRILVTNNNCRDSYPVWSVLYPFEIANSELDIDSKIAFVSERDFSKATYFTYLSRPSESDVRIVLETGDETGDDPDSAAVKISGDDESDYPSFTGDGASVVFEYLHNWESGLLRYDFEDDIRNPMNLPSDSSKPAGMKNMIVEFEYEHINGDDVLFNWRPYTDKEIFYTLQFRLNSESENFVEKKFFTEGQALLQDLNMGAEYLVRVCIVENGEEVATSLWKKIDMPEVAARATVELDENNPYLVHLNAWRPNEDTHWEYSWIIDNQEIPVQSTLDFLYEFGTSGTKTIMLKASNQARTRTDISDPITVEIVTDIVPTIEYVLANDSSYVTLKAGNSIGYRIDLANARWIISGPGQTPLPAVFGSEVIIPLDIFNHKVNVNLTLTRIPVNGQASTDSVEKNITIDLDFKDVKPVLTYEVNEMNERSFTFSGASSIGNINWFNALWVIYGDGVPLHSQNGSSSCAFTFPENGNDVTYTVALTVPRISDGQSETTTQLISVEAAPIEPVIDYEIITLMEGDQVRGAKILFSCSNSKGSNIDFANTRWSVPVAGAYGEQPTQIGPTAIYNLFDVDDVIQVEVSLTMLRRGGTDSETVTESINIEPGEVSPANIIVKPYTEKTTSGNAIVFDVLSSTGANIDWANTQWLLDGQYTRTGPVARMDVNSSGENQIVRYVCTVFRHGDEPIVVRGEVPVESDSIKPVITISENLGNNVFRLTTGETKATNIDWTRTTWYIFDGNESVVTYRGANIMHTFIPKSEAMGYPVMVEMYFMNDDTPFIGYNTVDIEGDELNPVITWDVGKSDGDANVILFSAQASTGSAIDWSQAKWTFGDSSESQYGATVAHEYPLDADTREYKVSLTLTRRNTNGSQEVEVEYQTITIGSDEINPVITAELRGDGHLVLSAEDSEGRGLLLDRSSWLFEGEGDNMSSSTSEQTGVINNSSFNMNLSATAGWSTGPNAGIYASATIGANSGSSTTTYDDYINSNESFSTSNIHTGATCRRYVGDQSRIVVTLFVYRIDPDGGMTGESITVNIDLDAAAQNNGVSYGK